MLRILKSSLPFKNVCYLVVIHSILIIFAYVLKLPQFITHPLKKTTSATTGTKHHQY